MQNLLPQAPKSSPTAMGAAFARSPQISGGKRHQFLKPATVCLTLNRLARASVGNSRERVEEPKRHSPVKV